jgi:glutathione synthase/RimK-type ligase-like ATP-grasp enzyme
MVCINEFLYLSLARTESRFGNKNEDAWDNKLNQLLVAVDCGLKIPSSIICNKKDSLRNFIAKYEKVIFKPLTYHYEELNEDHYIESSGTCLLKSSDFQKYESYFFPTLFQEYIEKKYEVRVFVWQENIFAMAIFSQNNKKTKIDFRNYDYKKPNRRVPYALPPDILERIKRLMTKLDLTTGSIDLICNQYDEYIFLEVNPSGQFGMISEPCNFYIERFIAKKLI